ncbi:aldo/keto reductase [Haloprofundus halobius]|uniref:aldo/keto reductase n=1 Tax=Haloprofundus halobius TaxID=2876194 RepID=UPI001CCCA9EE|nr:aldo/keto reductase [Haloprofundus halobius]
MEFPRLGLGTYQNKDLDQCATSVETALDVGYRHIDTAQGYDNEEAVGDGIRASVASAGSSERSADGVSAADIDRDDLFVATKLDTDNLGYDDVIETGRESAEKLGVDTIDLLYVHWPLNTYDPEETLPALDELRDEGVIDHVGLSNFRPDQLDEAKDHLDAPIFAHQVEMHPMLQQEELREYARKDDHWLVAYCPIARNDVADVSEIQDIAEKHGSTPAQVALAWLLSKDEVAPIPKATGEDHIRQNFEATELELDDDDVSTIDSLDREERIVDFDDAPWN